MTVGFSSRGLCLDWPQASKTGFPLTTYEEYKCKKWTLLHTCTILGGTYSFMCIFSSPEPKAHMVSL